MINHVHILIYPHAPLAKITKSVKNYSARKANAILGLTGAFWHDESFDRWIRSKEELHKIISYIEQNPVSAGLVARAEEWPFSSAARG